jgi:hypothetical protein
MRIAAAVCGLALAATPVFAQRMFNMETREGDEARRVFEQVWNKQTGDPENRCAIQVLEPRLDFGLNLWTGYNADFPVRLEQLRERDELVTVFRVTSRETGKTYYFGESERLQKVPKELEGHQKLLVGAGGGFRLGPGKYDVQWLLAHPKAGVCRKSFSLNAKLPKGTTTTLAPNEVSESMFNAWKGFDGEPGIRATVMIHAAPMRWRRNVNRLSAWERNVLLAMLRTVLDRGQIAEARVVVFDLEQGRTFFETDNITRDGYFRLARSLAQADFGTIDYRAYQRGEQHWPYLEEKMREETSRDRKSDAIIFIGPSLQYSGRPPAELRAYRNRVSGLFYIALAPFMSAAQDQISQLVRSLDGKVFSIWEPKDLAKAVARIREDTSEKTKAGTGND